MSRTQVPRVIQITDPQHLSFDQLRARLAEVKRLGPGRSRHFAVQLRSLGRSTRELVQLGQWLRIRLDALGGQLIVNDRLDLARLLRADGVHLGRHSVSPQVARGWLGSEAWLSCSCHDGSELAAALDASVSAVVVSPIFASPNKGSGRGEGALRAAVSAVEGTGTQVIALGGITAENGRRCMRLGAAGVASIRADLTALLVT